uniref:mTERF domain-containing protein 1, mitochondrial n=1 Tax=Aegilops tauschii TaxID=37682 RepID=R7WE42_AEGTA
MSPRSSPGTRSSSAPAWDRTLAPIVAGLSGLGLSRSEIAHLASLAAHRFRRKDTVSKLEYHLRLFRSFENLLRAIKFCDLISHSLERVVKPNVALLRECGLGDCDIAKLCISRPRMITTNPELVQAMVTCAQDIGVPRGSVMFRHALLAVSSVGKEEILLGCSARVEYLRNTFRWTDAEVAIAVSKAPALGGPDQTPTLHYVVKFLKENGLLKCDPSYYTVFKESEKTFKKKFIHPHKEAAPYLEKDYDAACKGEEPTNFRFT